MLLDASALLALLYEEPGQDLVHAAIVSGAAMSAANLSEVSARMLQDGWRLSEVSETIKSLRLHIVQVDWEVALLGSQYRIATKHLGLGLSDRLCLATARIRGLPVLTADRTWHKVQLKGVDVALIR